MTLIQETRGNLSSSTCSWELDLPVTIIVVVAKPLKQFLLIQEENIMFMTSSIPGFLLWISQCWLLPVCLGTIRGRGGLGILAQRSFRQLGIRSSLALIWIRVLLMRRAHEQLYIPLHYCSSGHLFWWCKNFLITRSFWPHSFHADSLSAVSYIQLVFKFSVTLAVQIERICSSYSGRGGFLQNDLILYFQVLLIFAILMLYQQALLTVQPSG